MPALWALGWTVTTLGGIHVEEQFTIFGLYGALTFSALSGLLLHRLLPYQGRPPCPHRRGRHRAGGTLTVDLAAATFGPAAGGVQRVLLPVGASLQLPRHPARTHRVVLLRFHAGGAGLRLLWFVLIGGHCRPVVTDVGTPNGVVHLSARRTTSLRTRSERPRWTSAGHRQITTSITRCGHAVSPPRLLPSGLQGARPGRAHPGRGRRSEMNPAWHDGPGRDTADPRPGATRDFG